MTTGAPCVDAWRARNLSDPAAFYGIYFFSLPVSAFYVSIAFAAERIREIVKLPSILMV